MGLPPMLNGVPYRALGAYMGTPFQGRCCPTWWGRIWGAVGSLNTPQDGGNLGVRADLVQ